MAWYDFILTSKQGDRIDLDAEQSRGADLDNRLRALNDKKKREGDYTDEQYAVVLDHQRTGATGDVRAQVDDAFDEGWDEGLENYSAIGRAGTRAVGGVGSALFRAVPWPVWIAGAVFAAWKLGLLKKLGARFK